MENKRMGWIQSSMNPEEISNTVKGAVLALSGTILLVAKLLDLPFTESDIAELASQLGIGAGAVWFVYGLVMKLVVWLGTKRN